VWNLVSDIKGKQGLRVFENMVLRTIFGSKRDGVQEGGENCTMRIFVICIHGRMIKYEQDEVSIKYHECTQDIDGKAIRERDH
jgi:hypothetical protein